MVSVSGSKLRPINFSQSKDQLFDLGNTTSMELEAADMKQSKGSCNELGASHIFYAYLRELS